MRELVKRAVLFDLYGTLVFTKRNSTELLELALRRDYNFLQTKGCSVDYECFKNIDQEVFAHLLNRKRDTFQEIDLRMAYKQILPNVGIQALDDIIDGSISAFGSAYEGVWELWPDVDHALKTLRKRGCALAIVSDAQAAYARRDLRQLGIEKFFDAIVFSSDIGWAKPHKAMFLTAIEKLGVDVTKAVMVGDTVDEDIVGAKKVGLKAVLVARTKAPHPGFDIQPDLTISSLETLIEHLDDLI